MKNMFAAIGCCCLSVTAHASDYTGNVPTIRANPSQFTPGNVRISIQVSGATGCPFQNWYSYDVPDNATGRMWGAFLVAAVANARQVHIGGTGTCDQYGIEKVSYIDLK